jgi:hypothetical protein
MSVFGRGSKFLVDTGRGIREDLGVSVVVCWREVVAVLGVGVIVCRGGIVLSVVDGVVVVKVVVLGVGGVVVKVVVLGVGGVVSVLVETCVGYRLVLDVIVIGVCAGAAPGRPHGSSRRLRDIR